MLNEIIFIYFSLTYEDKLSGLCVIFAVKFALEQASQDVKTVIVRRSSELGLCWLNYILCVMPAVNLAKMRNKFDGYDIILSSVESRRADVNLVSSIACGGGGAILLWRSGYIPLGRVPN